KSLRLAIQILFVVVVAAACKDERSELGDKYFKNGQYEKAIDAYTEYLRLEPTHIKSLYNRGRAYEEVGKHEEALADFNKVLKEDPQNANALISLTSDFYYRLQDYENTIFYAEKVLKVDESATAHTLKGKAQQKLGNLKEALSAYNAALSVDKEYVEAYISRGSLRVYLKQRSKACNDFRLAESLGASNAKDLLNKYCR
ncbi:tetratricopeptide repeat protein, partial [Fulvivirga sp. RKSG066]|uniref:tetratricopeptide repeat protein n=1 Tax=Fulvivirga aurantia TaxID=2529383 RepID=UPI0012BCB5D7